MEVAVVERADEAGGPVKTREVTVPGFRHDLFAMNLSLFAGSPFLAAYKEKLVAHGLGFSRAAHCFATPFPDGSWLGVSQDIAKTTQRIAAISSTDAERWRKMASDFATDAPHIFAFLASPMPSLGAARSVWKTYRAKGGAWMGELAQLVLPSSRDFLDAQFESEKLKVMMAAWGMHLDPARWRGGRPVTLSRIDGRSELRHGDRARRRRYHHQRVGRLLALARRGASPWPGSGTDRDISGQPLVFA